MPFSNSEEPVALDYRNEIIGRRRDDVPVKRYRISKPTVLLLSVCEILCWIVGAFVLYWLEPVSRIAFLDRGVEIPKSMVQAITIADWIVGWYWIALPLILAGIIVPKILLHVRARSLLVLAISIVAGLAVPLALVVYGLGLPKMIRMGIWP